MREQASKGEREREEERRTGETGRKNEVERKREIAREKERKKREGKGKEFPRVESLRSLASRARVVARTCFVWMIYAGR